MEPKKSKGTLKLECIICGAKWEYFTEIDWGDFDGGDYCPVCKSYRPTSFQFIQEENEN